MSFPQGPGNGNNPNPNNNRNNGNPFTNPFNRGNNGTNGKGNNNENRPIWQSPWLWGAVLVVMVVLMFQMFAGGGTKTIDTKDGFALINQGKATYAEITDNKQVVRLKLKNDYTKKNADTGKVTNYGKNVQSTTPSRRAPKWPRPWRTATLRRAGPRTSSRPAC